MMTRVLLVVVEFAVGGVGVLPVMGQLLLRVGVLPVMGQLLLRVTTTETKRMKKMQQYPRRI